MSGGGGQGSGDVPVGSAVSLIISRHGSRSHSHLGPLKSPLKSNNSTNVSPSHGSLKCNSTAISSELPTKDVEDKVLDLERALDRESRTDSNQQAALKSSTRKKSHSSLSRAEKDLRNGGGVAGISSEGEDMEYLTFNSALGEAGPASLGITVQTVSERGQDLGISIKSVIVGGAVSKVKLYVFCLYSLEILLIL